MLKNKRIDIIAPPFSGHLYPLIPLARHLQNEGVTIRFITGPQKIPLIQALGFHAVPLLNDAPHALENIANTSQPIGSNVFRLLKQLNQNLNLMPRVAKELRHFFTLDTPHLVIADSVATVAGPISDEFNIPWINTIATPFAIEQHTGTPAYLGGLAHANKRWHALRDWLARKVIRLSKKMIYRLFIKKMRVLGVRLYRPDGSEAIYSPYAILGLGIKELEFHRDWPACFKMIGPVLETPEETQVKPLSFPTHQPLVLVTLGTHLMWAKKELVEKMRPLMQKFPHVHFCISLGQAEHYRENPVSTGDNWAVYPYIPYSSELKHFTAVIHHGGAGITYSCIAAKKPSLVIPHDYDQFDFAKRIVSRQLGLTVKSITDKKAVSALSELFHPKWQQPLENMHAHLSRYSPQSMVLLEVQRLLNIDATDNGLL